MKTYQYRCHPSVLSHHALGKTECDESYCIEGNDIWSFFRRGAGIFFIMSHTATRASSWPYMDFWTFKLFVRSVPGWGYVPIWEMGVSMALYGNAATLWVFGVHKTDHTLLLKFIYFSSNCIVIVSNMVITRKRSLARVYKHIYIYIPGRVFFFCFSVQHFSDIIRTSC